MCNIKVQTVIYEEGTQGRQLHAEDEKGRENKRKVQSRWNSMKRKDVDGQDPNIPLKLFSLRPVFLSLALTSILGNNKRVRPLMHIR